MDTDNIVDGAERTSVDTASLMSKESACIASGVDRLSELSVTPTREPSTNQTRVKSYNNSCLFPWFALFNRAKNGSNKTE